MGVLTASNEKTRLIHHQKENQVEKKPYPKAIFFVIGNEFCERFAFYGLRTILTLYLTQRLYYSEDTGTIIYHAFSMLAYFSPVLGAIVADSFLGKFKTIFYVSIIYALGSIVLAGGAFPQALSTMKLVSLLGLVVIALGTGGIKPCVAAFGGDQFKEGQEKQLQQFFSVFYLSINAGSFISTFLTPILREDVHCFGERTCYPLAFGVPAMLMVVALLLFICGKPLYKIRPPEGNIALKVTRCVCYAVAKKFKSSEKKKEHWLDYADDKYEKKLINDIKILGKVLVLYIPLPVFWALFDQQASRWTLQATRMDGALNGYHIKADQMQVINPLLIITFIPLFESVFYPLLGKCKLLTKPLQRIATGGTLAALSFVVAGFVEMNLEGYYPVWPDQGFSEMTIINNFPCPINIPDIGTINAFKTSVKQLPLEKQFTWTFTPENCTETSEPYSLTFNTSTTIESMMITLNNKNLVVLKGNDTKEKAESGEPQIRLFYNTAQLESGNITFLFERQIDGSKHYIDTGSAETYGMSKYGLFPPGEYKIYAPYNETVYSDKPVAEGMFRSGGVYIISIYNKQEENRQITSEFVMVKGNEVSILWQIPQYFLITAGEIMFSITGLEFSYSQSPTSMKSVVQAGWLLTVAVGNLIVMIITKLKLFDKQSDELFLYGTLMALDMVIFAILAYFYKYVTIKTPSQEEQERVEREARGKANEAYVEETDFNK